MSNLTFTKTTLPTTIPITKMMNGLNKAQRIDFLESFEQELTELYGLPFEILNDIVLGISPDITGVRGKRLIKKYKYIL